MRRPVPLPRTRHRPQPHALAEQTLRPALIITAAALQSKVTTGVVAAVHKSFSHGVITMMLSAKAKLLVFTLLGGGVLGGSLIVWTSAKVGELSTRVIDLTKRAQILEAEAEAQLEREAKAKRRQEEAARPLLSPSSTMPWPSWADSRTEWRTSPPPPKTRRPKTSVQKLETMLKATLQVKSRNCSPF